MIYEFTYKPPARKSPTLKYGITDMYKQGRSRPENQITYLKALFGASVDWKVKLFAPNNAAARAAELGFVQTHQAIWGERPIAQLRP